MPTDEHTAYASQGFLTCYVTLFFAVQHLFLVSIHWLALQVNNMKTRHILPESAASRLRGLGVLMVADWVGSWPETGTTNAYPAAHTLDLQHFQPLTFTVDVPKGPVLWHLDPQDPAVGQEIEDRADGTSRKQEEQGR